MKKTATLIGIFLLAAAAAGAQDFGSLRGLVVDADNNPIPGVSITLTGSKTAPRSTVTSHEGNFRFLNLPAGRDYTLEFEMPGFKTLLRQGLAVSFGTNIRLDIVLQPAEPDETITVSGQTPALDPDRARTGYSILADTILSLPTARNPWVLLALAPGLLIDREDVGGDESGLQSLVVGHGAGRADSIWSLDGADISDPSVPGEAPAYVNVSNYEEIRVDYAGSDARARTGGFQLNFVTRHGGSAWSGTVYFDLADRRFELSNTPAALLAAGYANPGLNMSRLYGASFGGPLVRDKVWLAGAWGVQDVEKRNLTGGVEPAKVNSGYANLDFRISSSTRFNAFFEFDEKRASNRAAFGALEQDPNTLWKQTGPGTILKGQLEHQVGGVLLQAKAVYASGAFHLEPVGGPRTGDGTGSYELQSFFPVFHVSGNIDDVRRDRHQLDLGLSGNAFAENVLGADHELRFGAEFRTAGLSTSDTYEGNLILYDYGLNWVEADVLRDAIGNYKYDRISAYLQDTIDWGRLSLTLGLRYDRERAEIQDQTTPASPWLPQYLGAQSITVYDPGAPWSGISPRIAASWDIHGDGRDVVKLSLAIYGSQSGFDPAVFVNPAGAGIGLLWKDANGDKRVTANELWGYDFASGTLKDPGDSAFWLYSWGVNPSDPSRLAVVNKIDPASNTPLLDEIMLSYEKELFADFAARLELIYRKRHRLTIDRGIFADGTIETAGNWFLYGHNDLLNRDFWTRGTATVASYRTVSTTQFEQYAAAQLVLSKRYAHGWMLDGSFTYSSWTSHGDDSFDRTNSAYFLGAPVAIESTAADLTGVYLSSRWMVKLTGLVSLPFGFNFSAVFQAREGYIIPTYTIIRRPTIGPSILYGQLGGGGVFGDTRLPTLTTLNLRLEKTFAISSSARATLSVDGFNITNAATSLMQSGRIDAANFLQDQVILNPTVFRFGVRFQF